MAAASVVLGIWDSFQYENLKVENLDLEDKVEVLKNEAVKKLNTSKVAIGKTMTKQKVLDCKIDF